ncbi:uncharacterized protein mRpS34 [Venturia canescens]|uniref:uncharacterized protein mRpS34 n=1 Tax=Venturia canescens TaxID=32260 RepID=UPI001C9CD949|nr:uncharacterized protein LOC122414666 [Venturia canescens]
MPIKLIGRRTTFKGKTLWEILGNLKNFGVGRIIIRHMFQRYPEPSYFKVLKVAAMPNEDPRKVMVLTERVFRGLKYEKLVQIDSTSYKADYQLIPKDQEYKYKPLEKPEKIIVSQTMQFPPLLREILSRRLKAKGITKEPELPVWLNTSGNKTYRLAKEGETPTKKFTIGLGEPATPSLYANCKPI